MTVVDLGCHTFVLFGDLGVLLHECLGIADGHEVVGGYRANFVNLHDVGLLYGHEQLLVGLLDELAELVVGVFVHVREKGGPFGDQSIDLEQQLLADI